MLDKSKKSEISEDNIFWIGQATDDVLRFGAKTYKLNRLKREGFPVPKGFCLSECFISRLFEKSCEKPEVSFWTLVLNAYNQLTKTAGREVPVAVRSSSIFEDLPNASFAGQYDSFLNILNEDELLFALQKCWKSAHSSHATAYAKKFSPLSRQAGLSVLIQNMIAAEISGVIFTSHPVLLREDCIVVEAVLGLGSGLASGVDRPARLTFDKKRFQIIESELTEILAPEFINFKAWEQLLRIAIRIEQLFGTPQDIEWAYEKGMYWILQTRPITTCQQYDTNYENTLLTRGNIGEVMPGNITPLTWSVFIKSLEMEEDQQKDNRPSKKVFLKAGRAHMSLQALWDNYNHIWGIDSATVLSRGIGCDLLGHECLLSLRCQRPGVSEKALKNVYVWSNLIFSNYFSRRICRKIQVEKKLLLSSVLNANMLKKNCFDANYLDNLIALTGRLLKIHMKSSFLAFSAFGAAYQLVWRLTNKKNADLLVSPSPRRSSDSSQWGPLLTRLSDTVRNSKVLLSLFQSHNVSELRKALTEIGEGRAFLDELSKFAFELGNRSIHEFELNAPRWSEDPSPILAGVRARLRQNLNNCKAENTFMQPIDVACYSQNATCHIASPFRFTIKKLIKALSEFTELREITKKAMMKCFSEIRQFYLRLGKTMQEEGRLKQFDDIFFLEFDEIAQLMKGEESLVDEHRLAEIRSRYSTRNAVATECKVQIAKGAVLSGTGVSGGCIKGPARIIRDAASATVEAGDIIVAEATDPGWLPLFLVSGGIICELGGMLSHTATLARELRKPAVFSVPYATRIIKDGQQVQIDGLRGVVNLMPSVAGY